MRRIPRWSLMPWIFFIQAMWTASVLFPVTVILRDWRSDCGNPAWAWLAWGKRRHPVLSARPVPSLRCLRIWSTRMIRNCRRKCRIRLMRVRTAYHAALDSKARAGKQRPGRQPRRRNPHRSARKWSRAPLSISLRRMRIRIRRRGLVRSAADCWINIRILMCEIMGTACYPVFWRRSRASNWSKITRVLMWNWKRTRSPRMR